MPNDGVHAVVEAFDINSNDAIKVFLARTLHRANMRDACVIDEDVNALAPEELLKSTFHFRMLRNIARVGSGLATGGGDSFARCACSGLVYVQNANDCAVRRELQRNGLPNATTPARDYGNFAVQPESMSLGLLVAQSETPRFQGMKSS